MSSPWTGLSFALEESSGRSFVVVTVFKGVIDMEVFFVAHIFW
jgi:hypothetical protein